MSKKTSTFQRISKENDAARSELMVLHESETVSRIILYYIRDTSATYGAKPSWLEDLRKSYAAKMAEAKGERSLDFPDRKTPEECKLQGEFLEKLATKILRDKGIAVIPHKVEDRYEPDIKAEPIPSTGTLEVGHDWVTEVSNTNVGTYYPKKRLTTHLKNLEACKKKGYDAYWLVSHKKALRNVAKELDEIGVKVVEIGSVVLPENLNETYDMLKRAIEKGILDDVARKPAWW